MEVDDASRRHRHNLYIHLILHKTRSSTNPEQDPVSDKEKKSTDIKMPNAVDGVQSMLIGEPYELSNRGIATLLPLRRSPALRLNCRRIKLDIEQEYTQFRPSEQEATLTDFPLSVQCLCFFTPFLMSSSVYRHFPSLKLFS